MDTETLIENAQAWLLTSGLRILLIVVLMWISLRLARFLVGRGISGWGKGSDDAELEKRKDTLSGILQTTLGVVILAVGLMMVLSELDIRIGPILAAAGVLGLAVGFGAQKLVEDVISGFFILWSNQIRRGDVVQIAGVGGLVEKVDLRMVILRDLAGNVHYVRNGKIDIVTNMTKDYSQYVFDIGVAYREDVDQVIEVIKKVDEEMRADEVFGPDILATIEILGLDKFADSAVIIKARTKTKPIKQWSTGREFNRRLKKAFDERNIEIPFPHRTIYWGQDKGGGAPPLQVRNTAAAGTGK